MARSDSGQDVTGDQLLSDASRATCRPTLIGSRLQVALALRTRAAFEEPLLVRGSVRMLLHPTIVAAGSYVHRLLLARIPDDSAPGSSPSQRHGPAKSASPGAVDAAHVASRASQIVSARNDARLDAMVARGVAAILAPLTWRQQNQCGRPQRVVRPPCKPSLRASRAAPEQPVRRRLGAGDPSERSRCDWMRQDALGLGCQSLMRPSVVLSPGTSCRRTMTSGARSCLAARSMPT